jgi:hypothetical protein
VRERLFRGYCTADDRWQEVFALFRERREAITALYTNEPALTPQVRQRTLAYFEEFFAILDEPSRANRMIVRACRT